jgi:hypothetical protein
MFVRRVLAASLCAIGFIGGCLVAVCALGGEAKHSSSLSPDEWMVTENCLAIIRQCQMADGMIRVKGDGAPVWTVPYVSNFAAMALLAANDVRPNPADVQRVEQWLLWYAENQERDGTIFDRAGTVASYRSNGRRDSTDSYAATFLMAAIRCASPRERQEFRQATLAAMREFTVKTVYVERPALAILALLDGKARFPDLPVAGNLHGN